MNNTDTNIQLSHNDEMLIYQSQDGTIKVDVLFQDEMVWLNQEQMAMLFGKDRTVIGRHIRNVFDEGELQEELVCAKIAHTTQHGAIEGLSQTKEVKSILQDAGKISHKMALEKAETEYNQYKAKELEQQHLESIKELDADLKKLQQKNK